MRSADEIKLRDNDANNYDSWYYERGLSAVKAEDETVIYKLEFLENTEQKFLDFGCGTGRLTVKIKDQHPQIDVFGLDISPKSIDILNAKNKNIITKTFDASKDKIELLGFPKFDRILSMQMIQHLEKKGAINAINEIHNQLQDGGVAIIELYNYNGLNRILERIRSLGKIKKIQTNGLFFEYRYDSDEFKAFVIKNSDFTDISIFGCQNISRRWINKFPFLVTFDLWLSKFNLSKYLGYYFIAVMRK